MKRLKPAGGCIRGLMSLKQIGMVCFAFLFSIFSTNLFATGISANATGASCDNPTLGTYSGTSNLQANWEANKINLAWYSDDTQITNVQSAATTCNYDGTLSVPSTPPTKTGYTFNGWKVRGLPDGYTHLQYIESNGNQWIDTGVSGFDTGNWEIGAKWMVTGWVSNYGYIFGVYSNEQTNSYRVILQSTDNNAYYVSANSKAGGGSVAVTGKPKNIVHIATLRNNSFDFDGQTYSATTTGNTIPSSAKMFLFASSTGLKTKSRIYSAWAKKDGVLKYGLIPAKRNSDSVLGMYDTVSKTFFTNAGSGTFTAGPAVQ